MIIRKTSKISINPFRSIRRLLIRFRKPSLPLFHRVYPLSNEQLNQYFSKLNLNNKKVLTVGSSGDQILYSLLYGAKDITFIDINPYAKFYIDLKIAALVTAF